MFTSVGLELKTYTHHHLTGQITGKWQYLAESPKGKISIVELLDCFRPGKTLWGIYCLEGQLFKRIERFNSFYEAEAAAKSYLG